jgi:hypothetical protein
MLLLQEKRQKACRKRPPNRPLAGLCRDPRVHDRQVQPSKWDSARVGHLGYPRKSTENFWALASLASLVITRLDWILSSSGTEVAQPRAEDVGDKKDGFKQDLHFVGAHI